ncbi:unnamed protein product [Urochloa decumbens]|uniref:Uncharacterized protein n=1 Tax=Urochloa decumbens TaxID=240449 RepID=A0ABC9AWM1_9POAL
MAEAVVGVLIGKLGAVLAKEAAIYGASLLCKESSAVRDLFCEVHKAEEELEMMKAFLHDSEKFKDTSETTGILLKKIRDLAFQIEDIVDEFTYKLEEEKHGGFAARIKKKIMHVKIWRRLALQLRYVNAELQDVAKKRDLYDLPRMERCVGGHSCHARPKNQRLRFAKEEHLVGIKYNADTLKQWLLGDLKECNNKVVTVWGMGGAGKTTLVDHVYKIVKVDFDTAAWVTVSKSYQVEDLLKKIAIEFGLSVDASSTEMRNIAEAICNHLEGKRYILVLDDVWEKDVWINIMDAFPCNCISRIVLTSRKYEVASLAFSNSVIKVEPLGANDSWKLFCNVAFGNNSDKMCPQELQDLAAKFLQKCEGLPIAITCIGRLLSCRPLTHSAWKRVDDELELHLTKNAIPGTDIILKLSLEDLPYDLKNCFLHCAIFPEDHEMKRRRLMRHWITAGFIKDKENKTLEEVAEGYLNELVDRSLLQIVKKNASGRVRCCRMHDVVRRLALDKADKECFGKVYDGSGTRLVHSTRRLSIQSTDIAPLSQSGAKHIRAIYAFTSSVDIDLLRPIIASSSLLSTLDLQGIQIKMLPNEVFRLFNLRFLGLRNTGIEILPEAVGRLKILEVLDAFGTGLLSLPNDVAKLKKLRYLYASPVFLEGNLTHYGAVNVPMGIGNLTGLHALQYVKASLPTLCDVAALTELRTFAVSGVTCEHSLNLCRAIMNMSHLVRLTVTTSNENEVLPLEALCLPETISKLVLGGQLENKQVPLILPTWSHLNNLTRLTLALSKLDEDSFSSLVVLHGLCYLHLAKAYDGKRMYFPAMSFPKLQQLRIWGAVLLNQVVIEDGALKSLVKLGFSDCPELRHLPHGIEYLKDIEELYLLDTAEELIEKLRHESAVNQCNEELMKISHIRKVVVRLTEKDIWLRIH